MTGDRREREFTNRLIGVRALSELIARAITIAYQGAIRLFRKDAMRKGDKDTTRLFVRFVVRRSPVVY